jgi:hypothetical protein
MSRAQKVLDEFAVALGFSNGLPLDEAGELVFIADNRLEISVVALEDLSERGLAFCAHLGAADGRVPAAETVVHVANSKVAGDACAPRFAVHADGARVEAGMFIPLDNLRLQELETYVGQFIQMGLEVTDRIASLDPDTPTGAVSTAGPDEIWIRI